MRITAVNGSPRGRGGNTAKIVEAFLKGAESAGSSVQSIYLAEYDIGRCRGCHTCWSRGPMQCVVEDDMAKVIASLEGADMILLASPVYFSNISGLLKDFIDRLTMLRSPHCPASEGSRSSIPSMLMFSSCGFCDRREFEVISLWADRFAEKMGLAPAGKVFTVRGKHLASAGERMLSGVPEYLSLLEQAGRDAAENRGIRPEMTVLLEQANDAFAV